MHHNSYAPILLFTYKRLETLKLTVTALQQNKLASESHLYIFSDAAKTAKDEIKVAEVRKYLKTISGFKNIHITEAEKNKGLANSIISGASKIINEYGKVIVLEDDLITAPNFLLFMNQCLDHYKYYSKVFSISGYTFPVKKSPEKDVYFTKRGSSWGWGTWKERWVNVDWEVADYHNTFKNNWELKRAFNRMGSDLSSMLKSQMEGKLDSWAIRWCYYQFKNDLYTVYPTVSKVRNIGNDASATHTTEYFDRFKTTLDQSKKENFILDYPYLDTHILKSFLAHYSLFTRIKYKALNKLASFYTQKIVSQ